MRAIGSLQGSERAGLAANIVVDVHVDLYLKDGAAVGAVFWRGTERQPFLSVKDDGSGGLCEFTVVTNDDIPPHTLRQTHLHGQVEVYRRGTELVAVALSDPGRAQHPFLVLRGTAGSLDPDLVPEPGTRQSPRPRKALDGRHQPPSPQLGARGRRYTLRLYKASEGGDCDQHFESLRSALECFLSAPGESDPCLLDDGKVVLWLDLEAGLAPVFVGPHARTVEAAYFALEQVVQSPPLPLPKTQVATRPASEPEPEPEWDKDLPDLEQLPGAAVTTAEDDGPASRLEF